MLLSCRMFLQTGQPIYVTFGQVTKKNREVSDVIYDISRSTGEVVYSMTKTVMGSCGDGGVGNIKIDSTARVGTGETPGMRGRDMEETVRQRFAQF